MDNLTLATILLMILITLWWVLRPLLQPEQTQFVTPTDQAQMLAELHHRRDTIYAEIKSLDLDMATGKVEQGDYDPQRMALKLQAANILKQIDAISLAETADLDAEIEQLLQTFQPDEADLQAARHDIQASLKLLQADHCPNCQNSVEATDAFCSQCGTSLNQHCSQCGVAVMPDDRFCVQCGTELVAEVTE